MESRIKLLGHPIHPMLIVFPLGLLSTAVIFDVLYLVTDNADLATFSFWALAAGLVDRLDVGDAAGGVEHRDAAGVVDDARRGGAGRRDRRSAGWRIWAHRRDRL